MMRPLRSHAALALVFAVLLAVSGCATLREARGSPGQRLDPWENWNRKVFAFNEGLDERILKPVATAYANVVPRIVRQSVDNVFSNAADGWSAVNNILQGKPEPAVLDLVRFTTNSVFGFFGILDIASEFGIDHQYEDFGKTLGRWGMGAGAYVVWPLFGPSTVRDSIALPLDRSFSPAVLIDSGGLVTGITVLQIVNTRAKLLNASSMIDDIALDKYTFLRDAYLQRRGTLKYEDDAADAAAPPSAAASAAAPASAAASAAAAQPAMAPASSVTPK